MHWIVTLVVGGIVGWLASIVMKTDAQMGWIANIVVGVLGSILGYWLAARLGIATGGTVAHFLVALAGAALLIFILSLLGVLSRG